MLRVDGILETSLYVHDLDASERFYGDLFGLKTILSDGRMRALRVNEQQVLLLFLLGQSVEGADTPRGHIPGHDGRGKLHTAFRIDENTVDTWAAKLKERGIQIVSRIRLEQGGQSLYFHDIDGHVIELATAAIWDL